MLLHFRQIASRLTSLCGWAGCGIKRPLPTKDNAARSSLANFRDLRACSFSFFFFYIPGLYTNVSHASAVNCGVYLAACELAFINAPRLARMRRSCCGDWVSKFIAFLNRSTEGKHNTPFACAAIPFQRQVVAIIFQGERWPSVMSLLFCPRRKGNVWLGNNQEEADGFTCRNFWSIELHLSPSPLMTWDISCFPEGRRDTFASHFLYVGTSLSLPCPLLERRAAVPGANDRLWADCVRVKIPKGQGKERKMSLWNRASKHCRLPPHCNAQPAATQDVTQARGRAASKNTSPIVLQS